MVKQFCYVIMFFFIMCSRLAADILILNDSMILNGKIVEDKHPEYIRFVNYHGSFTVNYDLIKEIYRTNSYKEDAAILKKYLSNVNEAEVKRNYQTGSIKSSEHAGTEKNETHDARGTRAGIDFFYNRNYGDIKSEISSGMGIFSSVKIPAEFIESAEKLYISDIEYGAGYLYSAEGEKSIQSFSFSAGPVWSFSHSIQGFNFSWSLSGLLGLGYYSVKNGDKESEGVKWNITILAGPEYNFSSVIVTPGFRFDYIYDSYAPLTSFGFSLGFGRIF